MMAWRDELAMGQQTIDRFISEMANPTMSHWPNDCRCGSTPALACSEVRLRLTIGHEAEIGRAPAVDAALAPAARDTRTIGTIATEAITDMGEATGIAGIATSTLCIMTAESHQSDRRTCSPRSCSLPVA